MKKKEVHNFCNIIIYVYIYIYKAYQTYSKELKTFVMKNRATHRISDLQSIYRTTAEFSKNKYV